MYISNPLEYILPAFIMMVVSSILTLFSPFGVTFVVASVVRAKSKVMNEISMLIQIVSLATAFIFGIAISLLFCIKGSPFYIYTMGWLISIGVFAGISIMLGLGLATVFWQSVNISKS